MGLRLADTYDRNITRAEDITFHEARRWAGQVRLTI